jgi:hypothetical protein
MSLIAGPLGTILVLVLAVLAFNDAGGHGRIFIFVLVGSLFLIPRIFSSLTVSTICFSARIVAAIGFYLYYKWRNAL